MANNVPSTLTEQELEGRPTLTRLDHEDLKGIMPNPDASKANWCTYRDLAKWFSQRAVHMEYVIKKIARDFTAVYVGKLRSTSRAVVARYAADSDMQQAANGKPSIEFVVLPFMRVKGQPDVLCEETEMTDKHGSDGFMPVARVNHLGHVEFIPKFGKNGKRPMLSKRSIWGEVRKALEEHKEDEYFSASDEAEDSAPHDGTDSGSEDDENEIV